MPCPLPALPPGFAEHIRRETLLALQLVAVGSSSMLPVLLLTLLLILRCQAICEDGGLPIIRLRQGNRDVVEQIHVRAAERRGHLEAAPDPAEGRRILVNDADGTIAELQRFVERSLLRICRDCLVLSCSEISIWRDHQSFVCLNRVSATLSL